MDEAEEFRTPGQLLAHLLEERGWSNRVLAVVLEAEETGISKLVADKKAVTPEIAISLEEVFDVPADRFLALQRGFDLAKARLVVRPNPKRATRAQLFGGLPVAEMIKRGWLNASDVRDLPVVERELARFFGVDAIDDIEILPHAAKRTVISEDATPTQLAWLYRVRQIASEMIVAKYSAASGRRAIEMLRPLTSAAEEARKVPRILAECGIRFLIVESLPSAKIDGVCFWLGETAPVIGMTLRFDRIDNFWFVLRHELEHVLQEHGKSAITIDAELEGVRAGVGDAISEEERVANAAASEFCVPKKTMDSFIARKAPTFADRDILGVAATLRVHPGLVAGQLRFRTGQYTRFASHLAKIRSIVTRSAVVDGWGDVAQVGH
ncbi:ImmA/IrrE family metallo-endopeptidase [Variovorax dokdonensis]|uniref:ImmA/IrrE family metallo-endopeptidase n=1 Tax=Variovorax dokdonensis TaxID=344883 RepID=A0ABT7NG79_9BURK|nr:ImmA/IrrE family metallo-endopeptidase [Variovorax dokdonensis]MDM0046932.1 ImmA/IrrE family metallo-endopeptidase [Variovorax dokdonensis]